MGELMARMDNVAITARMVAIAFLSLSFARKVTLELRSAARAGIRARPGAGGVGRHGAAGESGDSRRTW